MTVVRTTFAALIASAIALTASSAHADGFDHIDELALQMQRQTRALYSEFRLHYSHAAHAAHLRSDAARLYYLARHIHEVAHFGGSLRHLESDLAQVDALFHHLEELVEHIEDDAFFGDGHVHGDTEHVEHLMEELEDTIHHLQADVRALRLHQAPVIIAPPYGHGYGYGQSHGGVGVHWNGGSIRIRF